MVVNVSVGMEEEVWFIWRKREWERGSEKGGCVRGEYRG